MKRSKSDVLNRQSLILEYLQKHTYANIAEIAKEFRISEATARRDISALKKSGDIKLVFNNIGLSSEKKYLPQFDKGRCSMSNVDAKEAIARQAACMIENGDTVFMNASSTALRIYPHIKDISTIIVTNNGKSLTAPRNPGTELVLVGGEVSPLSSFDNTKLSLTGNFAIENINRTAATKCILGVSGISAEHGLTSMAIQDPPINRAMIRKCTGSVIIVADHRKVGIEHNFHFADISDVTCLITDSKSDKQELDKLEKAGVKIILVQPL